MPQTEHADEARTGRERVVIVGGGPAGLAAAAALNGSHIDAVILERADEIGASWQGHYDRLHLHTVRWLSSLPGLRLPRREGRWVPRDGVVRYLKAYVPTPPPARSAIHCRHVGAARRAGLASRDRRRAGSSGHGDRGYRRQPGAGAARLAWHVRLHRELVHSSAYRTGSAYAGEDVLVVGPGNSGAEIDTNRRIARRRTHDGHGAG